ncbi:hypothetical protein C8Q73DRAFT_284005 [Cubamyces lactineus]|nr:hypothetical protein C8Q73DRAFT_284005 [Cubamyces lactineus]
MNYGSQNVPYGTHANASVPPTHLNLSPQDLMYLAGTVDRPVISASDADRLRRVVNCDSRRHDANREGPRYMRLSDAELRPAIAGNPSILGRITGGVAHQDLPNPQITLPMAPGGMNHAPNIVAPSNSLPRFQRFKIPLPADIDHAFKIKITSSGKAGYKLRTSDSPLYDCELLHIGEMETTIAECVDNATMSLEALVQDGFCVQRLFVSLLRSHISYVQIETGDYLTSMLGRWP